MPIQLNEENGGKFLVVHVTGTLVKADYGPFVSEFERLLRLHGKLRVLFDMTGLHGWDAGAAWEDLKFDLKHFADIERLAMVGDKKWQHGHGGVFQAVHESDDPILRSRPTPPRRGNGWRKRSRHETKE